jgi:LuxR family maltose regulon positive regulatory protein
LLHATSEVFLGAWRGRIREIVPDTTEAEEDLIDARNRPRAVHVRIAIARAMIETELGDPMAAVSRLERAMIEFEGRVIPHTTHDVPLLRAIVRALRLAGRADLALVRGLEFEQAIDRSRPRLRRLISEEIVRCACTLGELDTAMRARQELTGPCSLPLADAWIAIATGSPRTARSAVAALDVVDLSVRAPSRALDVLEIRARTASTGHERDELVAAAARLADEHGLARSFAAGLGDVGAPTARPPDRGAPPLSDRELVVLRGLATGVSHRELAAQLQLSHNTVKTHLRAVYRKLGALDRDDAVMRARSAGLLSSAVGSSER